MIMLSSIWALGEKPAAFMENALENISRMQYHGLFITIPEGINVNQRDLLRNLVANCRRPEFPVNTVFLTTATENIPVLVRTFQNAKIQTWYVVTNAAQLENVAKELHDSELTGLLLISNEPLSEILQALENTKIILAQNKSNLRLGAQIPSSAEDEAYQIFNTINIALLPTAETDPLAIDQDLEPFLSYAHELHTPTYIVLTNTLRLKQSTPAQLNKYIAFLNSVLDNKKYKGLCLSSEDMENILENKK